MPGHGNSVFSGKVLTNSAISSESRENQRPEKGPQRPLRLTTGLGYTYFDDRKVERDVGSKAFYSMPGSFSLIPETDGSYFFPHAGKGGGMVCQAYTFD